MCIGLNILKSTSKFDRNQLTLNSAVNLANSSKQNSQIKKPEYLNVYFFYAVDNYKETSLDVGKVFCRVLDRFNNE